MTREDSIALADRLEKDYSKLEKLQKESYQNTKEIDRPYTPRRKMGKEERLGFNWYPVIGFLVCIPLLILALLFYVFAFMPELVDIHFQNVFWNLELLRNTTSSSLTVLPRWA